MSVVTYVSRKVDCKTSDGKNSSQIKEVWLVAVVLTEISENVQIIRVTRTQQVNLWRYGLKMLLQITEKDLKELPEIIELPDKMRLTIRVEGKPPTSYGCGQKGLIRRMCSLNIQHLLTKHDRAK